jgi:hypothetical protein
MGGVGDERFSLSRIREIDLVGYLGKLGYQPVRVRKDGTDFWYLSPLRNENEASFHVNQVNNQWYDFALVKGGNTIDFCLLYHKCSIRELLEKFNADQDSLYLPVFDPSLHEGRTGKESKLIVTGVRPLYAFPLKNYLHERSIPIAIANQFCKEIQYNMKGRSFYGIGFQNDGGGYEIRSKNYKLCSSPKEVTTIDFGAPEVQVFEGFMDFLSYKALYPDLEQCQSNYVILNGAGLFDRAIAFLSRHEHGGLWLDRETTGMAYTAYALSMGLPFQDESGLYEKFKDLNDWLIHKGEILKLNLKPGFRQNSGGP